ncbi:MAG: glycosyltransferase family 4 protein [Bacteroidetes bacterium]|nr:glycosyltransferase family 4 protein [Bacteroidota bacterium]
MLPRVKIPNSKFVFVGGTDADIKKFKKEAQGLDNVLILGHKPFSEIPRYLAAADVLVLPNSARTDISKKFTSPLKMFEYMAMGKIVVAPNYEPIRSVIDNGRNGIIFSPKSKDDLVNKLNSVVNDNQRRQTLGEKAREKILKQLQKRRQKVVDEKQEEHLHSEMQYHLLKIGNALNYDVITASNDRSKSYNKNKFSFICIRKFPKIDVAPEVFKTIKLIDVVWFKKGTNHIVCAFEIEKSTTIYSGILRLTDLSFSLPSHPKLYIIIPDTKENEAKLQLNRPSLRNSNLEIFYILISELREHCDALCKFGNNHHIMKKIAKKA